MRRGSLKPLPRFGRRFEENYKATTGVTSIANLHFRPSSTLLSPDSSNQPVLDSERSPVFKAEVALEEIKGVETVAKMAQRLASCLGNQLDQGSEQSRDVSQETIGNPRIQSAAGISGLDGSQKSSRNIISTREPGQI